MEQSIKLPLLTSNDIYYIMILLITKREVMNMAMERLLIQVPPLIKQRLDELRSQGYTASGYIRALLERELSHDSHIKGDQHNGS